MSLFVAERGVCAISLGQENERAIEDFAESYGRILNLKLHRGITSHPTLLASLKEYFMGWRTSFDIPLYPLRGTHFQRTVWQILQTIPYGRCVSYQWVARQVRNPKATRAVGNAVGKNPIPILIPCHRVIRKDGSLGGFSSGLRIKKALLEIEQCNPEKAQL